MCNKHIYVHATYTPVSRSDLERLGHAEVRVPRGFSVVLSMQARVHPNSVEPLHAGWKKVNGIYENKLQHETKQRIPGLVAQYKRRDGTCEVHKAADRMTKLNPYGHRHKHDQGSAPLSGAPCGLAKRVERAVARLLQNPPDEVSTSTVVESGSTAPLKRGGPQITGRNAAEAGVWWARIPVEVKGRGILDAIAGAAAVLGLLSVVAAKR